MNTVVNNVAVLFAISLLSFSRFSEKTLALKLSKLVVPQYVSVNSSTNLECLFKLENTEKLYRVQWYKDNDEFYRYDQKSNPRQFTYSIDRINVDKPKSNEHRVVLSNVNLMMSGVYKCEVSVEERSFSSVQRQARMDVIALPKEDPRIDGQENIYQIGDAINLTCTSDMSYPPAKLRWFINNQEIPSECTYDEDPDTRMVSTKTSLILFAEPEHFVEGEIEIQCQATITVRNHTHEVITLPIQQNNLAFSPSKFSSYLQYARVSAKGNAMKVAANVFLNLAPIWLRFLLNDIT